MKNPITVATLMIRIRNAQSMDALDRVYHDMADLDQTTQDQLWDMILTRATETRHFRAH